MLKQFNTTFFFVKNNGAGIHSAAMMVGFQETHVLYERVEEKYQIVSQLDQRKDICLTASFAS